MCRRMLFAIGCCLMVMPVFAQSGSVDNVILVTIDGLRWQEVFRGLDQQLVSDERYTENAELLLQEYASDLEGQSAYKLMPFLHDTIFKQGSYIGNRDAGSCAKVNNPWYFSYPGYSEILTGQVDPDINTNNKVANPNVSFLEWLLKTQSGFENKVAAFGSWDVFPWILNTERSGIPVNVQKLEHPQSEFEVFLNRLYDDIPSPWETVRLDAFTHHYALSYLEREKPKALYISYGETDDFAHDGEYDQYINAAHRTDRHLKELWEMLQADPQYRDNTVLFITVDHGRGEQPIESWQHHASRASLEGYMESLAEYENGIVGSDSVWMAAIGPGIEPQGLVKVDGCARSDQIAATLLRLLGKDPNDFNRNAGKALVEILQ